MLQLPLVDQCGHPAHSGWPATGLDKLVQPLLLPLMAGAALVLCLAEGVFACIMQITS